MMKRFAFLITLVAGIGIYRPVHAAGLTALTDWSCVITKLGEDSYNGAESIGKDDCDNSTVTFRVTGPQIQSYEVRTGPNCTIDKKENCDEMGIERQIQSSFSDELTLNIADLLSKYNLACLFAERTINVFIFPSGATTGKECTAIKVDTAGPAAPTGVTGESGEHELTIKWTEVPGAEKYKVYYQVIDDCEENVDAAKEVETAYAAAVADAWETLANNPDAQIVADAGTSDTEEVDPNVMAVIDPNEYESEGARGNEHKLEDKADPGESLVVRVTALDESGNESVFSDAVCVRVIRTRGFCDSTDVCKDGCSVGPVGKVYARTAAGFVVGLLTLFALVWARRRSRS